METERNKRDRFLDLANKRVNRVIKDLALVTNLANRKNYEYSDEEAKKIIRAIQTEVDNMKAQFSAEAQPQKGHFKL